MWHNSRQCQIMLCYVILQYTIVLDHNLLHPILFYFVILPHQMLRPRSCETVLHLSFLRVYLPAKMLCLFLYVCSFEGVPANQDCYCLCCSCFFTYVFLRVYLPAKMFSNKSDTRRASFKLRCYQKGKEK